MTLTRYARTSSFFFLPIFRTPSPGVFLISVNPYDEYGQNKGVQDIQERFFFFPILRRVLFCSSGVGQFL